MKNMIKCVLFLLLTAAILLPGSLTAHAAETAVPAREISGPHLVTDHSGIPSISRLFDGKLWENSKTTGSAYLTLEYAEGMGSLYLQFMNPYGAYTVTNNDSGAVYTAGTDLFIHEFIDLIGCFGTAPKSVTISFENGPAQFHELDVYTQGRVPDSVQKWEHPEEGKVDLMLFATHSDDDQLFFAGLLPYYGVERGYEVLVVYLTDHNNTAPGRRHEVLNGLWAVGIRNYPVLGNYPDFGDAQNLKEGFQKFEARGYSRESMTGFVVEQLRRFKPYVAVGHDFNGEYGHAQHRVYAQLVADAVAVSSDSAQYLESAEAYGTWDVPKTYIHLYKDNKIVMDWDQPMESFDGMTPFAVSKELGFSMHNSQQKGWAWYFEGMKTATQIKKYSPCQYGLYRSTAGEDVEKNDMFENLTNHTELDIIAAEQAKLEEEKQAESLAATPVPTDAPAESTADAPTEPATEAATNPPEPQPAAPPAETCPAPKVQDAETESGLVRWIAMEIVLAAALIAIVLLRKKKHHR